MNKPKTEQTVVVGYAKVENGLKDELKRVGASHRRRNDPSGLIIVRGDFRNELEKIDVITNTLWEFSRILVTEKTIVAGDLGLVIRIDSYTNEQRAIDTINRLLDDNISEMVYRPNQIHYFDSKQIIKPETKVKTKSKSKARKIPVPVPYTY